MSVELQPWDHQDYVETTWGELVNLRYGKGLKNYKGATGEVPVYGTNGPVGFCDSALCSYPSIIIGRKGAYRGVHFSDLPFYVIDTAFFVEPKFDINLKWAYYYLLTVDINGLDSGSAIPSTRREDFYALRAKVPPRKVQDKIVQTLDLYNFKIDLNRQTNQTLEQIAQTLFKSWFVDFEPTRAKIAAKQAGQDPERAAMAAISGKAVAELGQLGEAQLAQLKTTAALFPDELVESELGEVPEGWEVGTLADLSQLNSLSWTKKSKPDELWYVDLANTKHGVIEDINYYSWEDAPSRARRVLRVGDTIVGTVRPGNRSFSFIGQSDKQLTASTGFAVLTPNEDHLKEFIYLAATSDENIDRLAHLADGGAYPAVRPDVVPALDIVIPSDSLINRFSLLTKSLFEARNRNLESENTLKNVRDTLLPKLLSGELSPTTTEAA